MRWSQLKSNLTYNQFECTSFSWINVHRCSQCLRSNKNCVSVCVSVPFGCWASLLLHRNTYIHRNSHQKSLLHLHHPIPRTSYSFLRFPGLFFALAHNLACFLFTTSRASQTFICPWKSDHNNSRSPLIFFLSASSTQLLASLSLQFTSGSLRLWIYLFQSNICLQDCKLFLSFSFFFLHNLLFQDSNPFFVLLQLDTKEQHSTKTQLNRRVFCDSVLLPSHVRWTLYSRKRTETVNHIHIHIHFAWVTLKGNDSAPFFLLMCVWWREHVHRLWGGGGFHEKQGIERRWWKWWKQEVCTFLPEATKRVTTTTTTTTTTTSTTTSTTTTGRRKKSAGRAVLLLVLLLHSCIHSLHTRHPVAFAFPLWPDIDRDTQHTQILEERPHTAHNIHTPVTPIELTTKTSLTAVSPVSSVSTREATFPPALLSLSSSCTSSTSSSFFPGFLMPYSRSPSDLSLSTNMLPFDAILCLFLQLFFGPASPPLVDSAGKEEERIGRGSWRKKETCGEDPSIWSLREQAESQRSSDSLWVCSECPLRSAAAWSSGSSTQRESLVLIIELQMRYSERQSGGIRGVKRIEK